MDRDALAQYLKNYSPRFEIGDLWRGAPEKIALFDETGFHLYSYKEEPQPGYVEEKPIRYWFESISSCRNHDELSDIDFPRVGYLSRYLKYGLDSLGYLSVIYDNPEFSVSTLVKMCFMLILLAKEVFRPTCSSLH